MRQLDELELVVGDTDDYASLSAFHYRSAHPATLTRVLAIRDTRPSVVGRYLARRNEWRVVGVLVESMPALNCAMRDVALRGRYGKPLNPKQRARLINRELRVISRVVIHPQWRGLGLAVRLVRHALAESTTVYTEAIAAMGRVNPFFERAGMTVYPRPPHRSDARLLDVLASAGLETGGLTVAGVQRLGPSRRDWFCSELQRWYRHHQKRGQPASDCLEDHLLLARHRLAFKPVYYLKHNPLHGDGYGTCDTVPGRSRASPGQQQCDARGAARETCTADRTVGSLPADHHAAVAHRHIDASDSRWAPPC